MTTKTRENIQSARNPLKWLLLIVTVIFSLTSVTQVGLYISAMFTPQDAAAQVTDVQSDTLFERPPSASGTTQVTTATIQPTNTPPAAIAEVTILPSPTPLLPTPTPMPYVIASANGVNIRRGPGTAYEKVGLLVPSAHAPIIGWSGAWWQIDYAGEAAFVFGDIVTAHNVHNVPEVDAPTLPESPNPEVTPIPEPAPAWAVNETRWIDVDLSEQVLTAYEGQSPVKAYLVSTGLPQTPTPIGQYRIWIKLKTDDMAGADYYIEDVPWVMYFYQGYGLHGVTWHANFGNPMSHGCVNQPNDMAEWLFNFADVGTLVNIHE